MCCDMPSLLHIASSCGVLFLPPDDSSQTVGHCMTLRLRLKIDFFAAPLLAAHSWLRRVAALTCTTRLGRAAGSCHAMVSAGLLLGAGIWDGGGYGSLGVGPAGAVQSSLGSAPFASQLLRAALQELGAERPVLEHQGQPDAGVSRDLLCSALQAWASRRASANSHLVLGGLPDLLGLVFFRALGAGQDGNLQALSTWLIQWISNG